MDTGLSGGAAVDGGFGTLSGVAADATTGFYDCGDECSCTVGSQNVCYICHICADGFPADDDDASARVPDGAPRALNAVELWT